jgi:hypothetical protein
VRQISPDGQPTGSWVVPEEPACADPTTAAHLLVAIERRAVVGVHDNSVDDIISTLRATAGISADGWWTAQRFSPVEVFDDVLARRGELATTVAVVRQSGRTVAPLQRDRAFSPYDQPVTVTELAQIASPVAAPVVADALRLSRLLRWLVELWAKTEQVKN